MKTVSFVSPQTSLFPPAQCSLQASHQGHITSSPTNGNLPEAVTYLKEPARMSSKDLNTSVWFATSLVSKPGSADCLSTVGGMVNC